MLGTILAVGLHLGSVHTNIDEGYSPNNFNPGGYVEFIDNTVIGAYLNSDMRTSMYIGKTFHHKQASIMVGMVGGYSGGARLAIIPSYSFPVTKEMNTRIWYVPKVETAAEVVHFSIEWRM